MFKRSLWLEKYGLVPKIFLAVLLFISIGGLNFFVFIKEVSLINNGVYSYNAKLESWDRPPAAYKGAEFDDWTKRHKAAEREIKALLQQAEAKGDQYTLCDYFHDYDELMNLEDKYNLRIAMTGMFFPLEKFVRLRDRNVQSWGKNTPEQETYIKRIQKKISLRSGQYNPESTSEDITSNLRGFFFWLIKSYLMFMGFWLLIYLIRFQEQKKAKKKVMRHIHNTERFYEDYEDLPGTISLRNELLLCPWRFISRVILWPFFCMKYPFYESTAEMLRYNRLKAEFLRYKPVGYQLTALEDQILRGRAKRRVKNFSKAILAISEFQIYPTAVRKSLAVAYLSLVLGIALQPAIAFASQYSDKVQDHFGGESQIVQVEHQQNLNTSSHDPPQDDWPGNNFLALAGNFFPGNIVGLIVSVRRDSLQKLQEIFMSIDHVPRLPVVFRVAL